MAESEKKTSSSVNPKEKKSLFDDDIGNEFLGSWKSMSVMDDDKLDFGFDTVSTGKKKAFNFDKLDMDFDLGGDFGKLSSFKVDMSDLDFPASSKKAAKPKDRSEGESPMGNHQGKKDSFSFSFDFNELDNFEFGSTLEKGEKTTMKNLDVDGVVSDRSKHQGSKINQAGGSDAFFDDRQTEKPPASESVTTSKVETTLVGGAAVSSLNDILPSGSGMNEDVVVSHGARTSTEKSISGTVEETERQSCSQERTVPSEPYASQTTQILAVQSLSKNDLTEDIVSNVGIEVGSLSMEVDIESGVEQTANGGIVDGTELSHESSQPQNSDTLHLTVSEKKGGESRRTGGKIQTDNTVEAEPMPDDSDIETPSIRSLSGTAPQECNTSKDIKNLASKLSVTLASEPVAVKMAPIKERESGVVQSKFFRSSAEPEPQLHHPSSEGVGVSSSGSEGISATQSGTAPQECDTSKDIQNSASKSLVTLSSEPVADKIALIKEKESGVVRSKFFRSSAEPEPQLHHPSSEGVSVSSSGSKVISATQSGIAPQECNTSKDIQNSASKFLVTSASEPVADKIALIKEKESGVVQSKFFTSSVQPEPRLHHPSSEGVGVSSSGSKVISAMQSGIALQECNTSKDIQNSASKLLVKLASEPVADKIALIKEKEAGVVRSKFFRISVEPEPQLHHPSSDGAGVSPSGSKGISATLSSHPEIGKRQRFPEIGAHLGRKLVGDSKPPFRELSKGEPALLGIEKNVKTLWNIRESINSGVQNGCKPVVTLRPPADKEVPKGNPAGLGSEMNIKDLHNFGVIPAGQTDKTTKSNTQTSEKSRIVVSSMGSMRNSKIISAEGLKAVKKTSDLSSLKISKSMGEIKGPSATREREISFLEKKMEVKRNKTSKIILPVPNAEKNMPLITSLKRKTIEAMNADLVLSNPPKRLSLSPRENRNFKECSESIVDDQVCDNGDQAGCKTSTVLYDNCSGLQRTHEVIMKDVEISSATENDGNIEKAEAYAKELEDICNMLKKKHEEAKEIMVRAIVTNNSLLMLNHPIFDEKIRMVEKFAAQLVLK